MRFDGWCQVRRKLADGRIIADHNARTQLEERVRELEAALALSLKALEIAHRDVDDGRPCYACEAKRAARALLSPQERSEGQEEEG